MKRTRRYFNEAKNAFRGVTSGLNVREIQRTLGTDASAAYQVLRDHSDTVEPEPEEAVSRFLHRAKVLYCGIRDQLVPARRLLFSVAIGFVLVSLLYPGLDQDADQLLLLLSIVALLYLLLIELADRVRVRDELEIAREIQRDLLPSQSPLVDGYSFAHSYEMASQVGGDYHDIRALDDGRVAIIIGDASGHGIAAGLLMAIANATLKTVLEIDPRPQTVLRLLNTTLFRTGDRRAFVTLFYGLLEPSTGAIEYGIAGHPFPLHRAAGGEITELGRGSLPLGMRPEVDPVCGEIHLGDGDLLLLFTDGLPEAMDATSQESFGFDRLRSLLGIGGTAYQLHDRTRRAFDEYTAGTTLTDDLTLLTVERSAGIVHPDLVPPLSSIQYTEQEQLN